MITDEIAEILRRTFGADEVQAVGCAKRIAALRASEADAGEVVADLASAWQASETGDLQWERLTTDYLTFCRWREAGLATRPLYASPSATEAELPTSVSTRPNQ